jgi:hypothetical protein
MTSESNEVDVLDQDSFIPGQKFVCVSFISPEHVLKQKNIFLFEHFVKTFDLNHSFQRFQSYLEFVSYKYNISLESMMKDFTEYANSEKEEIKHPDITSHYTTFLENHEDSLTTQFNKEHKFQTNVRGVKIRGSFETQEEAENKCKQLRKQDPNHDIFVGPVGVWMPWEPNAYKTGKVEYLEKDLNNLMHEKIHNQEISKRDFEARLKQTKIQAIEENKKLAKKSGTKLSQNVTSDGTLYKTNNSELPSIDSHNTSDDFFDELNKNVENKMKT